MSKQHPTAEVFAEALPHVHNQQATHTAAAAQQPSPYLDNVVAPRLAKPANFRRKASILTVAACALAIPGLLSTIAIPAYGATPVSPSGSSSHAPVVAAAQSLSVSPGAADGGSLSRGTVTYVAPKRPALVRWAPVTNFGSVNLSGIAGIAARYLGVPYKFGGESPAGFDCSGLVEYVYAQVGIRLPHSAAEQGRMGHRVSVAAAVPGDVVVMNGGSHVGIYVGGGKMIDAPEPGRVVSVDKIYDNDYYIVSF